MQESVSGETEGIDLDLRLLAGMYKADVTV